MHLAGYPKYFIKDGKRRAVYFTADARDLKAMGWKPEEAAKPVSAPPKALEPVKEKEPEKVEVDIVIDGEEDSIKMPEFEFMTKAELVKYASERGVTLDATMLKSEMVEACKGIA